MEQYSHKVAAIYPDQSAAQAALEQLEAAGFSTSQVRLIGPHDPATDKKLEPEGDEIPKEFIKDTAIGTGLGGAVGAAGATAMAVTGVALYVAQPLLATLMTVATGAGIGTLAGALKGLRIKEDAYVAMVQDALRRGHWAVVALGRNTDEEARAHAVFKDTIREQEIKT